MNVNKQLTLPNLIYFYTQQLCIIPYWPNYPYFAVFRTCSDDDELPLLDRLADGKKGKSEQVWQDVGGETVGTPERAGSCLMRN